MNNVMMNYTNENEAAWEGIYLVFYECEICNQQHGAFYVQDKPVMYDYEEGVLSGYVSYCIGTRGLCPTCRASI